MSEIIIQRPGTIDVTKNNPNNILYIVGNETTDGSIRFMFADEDPSSHIESREDGVWNDTGLRLSSSSLLLGRDMFVSALGGFIETSNLSDIVNHIKAIIPHIQFNISGTTSAGHMPILDIRQPFDVFSGPSSGEITGTIIGQAFFVSPTRILHSATHLTGSISSTAPVEVSYYKGGGNDGLLLNRFNLPANSMVAGQPFTIVYDSDFGFEDEENIFFEFVSDNTLSFAINNDGDIITSQDGHILDELDIMLDEFVVANDLSLVFDNDLNIAVHNRF